MDPDPRAADRRPVYQQIADQVRRDVAAGRLAPGAPLPPVRELAHRLGVNAGTVARAYADLADEGVIVTRRGGGSAVAGRPGDPYLTGIRDDRLSSLLSRALLEALSLGFQPEEVEASFALQVARWRESRAGGTPAAEPAPSQPRSPGLVLAGSHDLAVELLLGQLRRACPELALTAAYVGSLAGLVALGRGDAHLAGCHLLDEETGEYNWPFVRRLLPGQEVALITVVERVQGLMVARGNPLGIAGLADLAQPGVRLINRQRGAGTRVLLDGRLRQLGIRPTDVAGYEREAETHTGVAAAVAAGSADVGLGIQAAARAYGLDFLPLQRERYDLALLQATLAEPATAALLAALRGEEFRRVVAALGGYDVRLTGQVVLH